MSKKELRKAYKSLNKTEYRNIIKDAMLFFDNYDGEYITMLTPDTVLTIEKHFYNGVFMGYNIKANDVLLDTKSTKGKARKFIKRLNRK